MFALIEAEKANFPTRFMRARLGVSPSGFYAWWVAESFFAVLECELLDRNSWPTRHQRSPN